MLPDVIDEFALKNRQRNEAIFYSFYVFFTKLATGIAIALSQIVLEYSGYIDCPNGCCQQPKSIDLALRMLIVPGPVILLLLALIFLFFHPINENKRKEIKDKLNALR
jgi:Na+/melibiose symporter-like transporter